jgi:hypothetical protein
VNEFVILEGCQHEVGIIHPAGYVAGEDGVADMPAPHWQSLALAFFKIAAPYNSPPGIAGKNPPARFNLIINFHGASKPTKPASDLLLSLK